MMNSIDQNIISLCNENTYLNNDEVNKIIEVSKSIDLMANFYESDVFIDILNKDKLYALVVAHSKPENNSLYNENVVGKKALKINEPGVIESLVSGKTSRDIKALTQEYKIVKQTIQPIIYEEKVIGVIIVEKDVSNYLADDFNIDNKIENKKSYNFINLFKKNNFLLENLNSSILIFDDKGLLKIKNKNADELYKTLLLNEVIENAHYDILSLENDKFKDYNLVTDVCQFREICIRDTYLKIKSVPLKDGKYKLAKIIQDITYIKKKEAELVLKSVAVKEAHHRVKNNLYTVISLLRKQSRLSKDEAVKNCLDNITNRVFAILSTHHLLSKEVDNNISIQEAINLLVGNIKGGYCDNKEIHICITGDDIKINGEKSTALLLVINEVIQNCYDHAFKDRTTGNIQILINNNEDTIQIAIVDDGIGMKNNMINSNTLGSFIIDSYIQQVLKGEIIRQSNDNGTRVQINIPI